MHDNALPAMVLDNGSDSVKCGYGGEHFPACVVPTLVGRRRRAPREQVDKTVMEALLARLTRRGDPQPGDSDPQRGSYPLSTSSSALDASLVEPVCGSLALEHRHSLELTRPVRNGVIADMEDMQLVWDHIFFTTLHHKRRAPSCDSAEETAGASLAERRLFLCEAPLLTMSQRSRIFEVLFEQYHFAGVQAVHQGVLSVFCAGQETGLAVECGDSLLHCTPIFDGYPLRNAHRTVPIGGHSVSELLSRLLQRKGLVSSSFPASYYRQDRRRFPAPSSAAVSTGESVWRDLQVVRTIKEKLCYTAVDLSAERQLARDTTSLERSFRLPDGAPCMVGQERFEATEVLFTPSLMDVEAAGLSSQLWDSIQAADMDLRAQLYAHIVLSGGSSLFRGLPTRLQADLECRFLQDNLKGDRRRLKTTNCPISVEAAPRRRYMSFLGGCALAELTSSRDDMWMQRGEWLEAGVGALHTRFGDGPG